MLAWLVAHKTIVFDGTGVAALLLILALVFRRRDANAARRAGASGNDPRV
jgi:hypothetical protein